MITIEEKEEIFDIVEQCTQERQNTNWSFKLITNVTISVPLLKTYQCEVQTLFYVSFTTTYASELSLTNKDKEPYKDHLCLFSALARCMNGLNDLNSHTSRYFNQFVSKSDHDPKIFHGVIVEHLPIVEEIVPRNIFVYDFDIEESEYAGELLRLKSHIIHTNDIDSFFKCFRCPSCDTIFSKSENFNKHLLKCKDRARHI